MAIQTTYNLSGAGNPIQANDKGIAFCKKFAINTALVNVAAADILKLMVIPAKVLIEEVIVEIVTAESGTLTMDIGDYAVSNDAAIDADGYHDGTNGNAAAGTVVSSKGSVPLVDGAPNTIRAYTGTGKYYPAATAWLGVLINDAADTAVFNVYVRGVDFSNL